VFTFFSGAFLSGAGSSSLVLFSGKGEASHKLAEIGLASDWQRFDKEAGPVLFSLAVPSA